MMAIEIRIAPNTFGESVKEATLLKWLKADGESVRTDEPLCEFETDKANTTIPSAGAGVLHRLKREGELVRVGEVIARLDGAAASPAVSSPAASHPAVASSTPAAPAPAAPSAAVTSASALGFSTSAPAVAPSPSTVAGDEAFSPAVRHELRRFGLSPSELVGKTSGTHGHASVEDVYRLAAEKLKRLMTQSATVAAVPAAPPAAAAPARDASKDAPVKDAPVKDSKPAKPAGGVPPHPAAHIAPVNGVRALPVTKIRAAIARNLKQSQSINAMLTTFNEIDMSAVMALREQYKDTFEKTHGVSLGFMSFFVRASVMAAKFYPDVNAFYDADGGIVNYYDYMHLSVAVSTERGLTVPVLRDVQDMSLAKIESEIKRVASAARDGKLSTTELSGGTFTITNGGVFGSLLSTPIINLGQSAILGLHKIEKRPVVVNDAIVVRPMMYVALSYDHRLIDGRGAVGFLVKIKEFIEDPARLLLQV